MHQDGDSIGAGAQGREVDLHYFQPVVEVFAKFPVSDLVDEIDIGGGDNPNIDLDRAVLTYRRKGLLLKEAEEAQLHPG